jgi:peptidoglycan/LPS O-acetylase OafA/YrhL
LGNISKYAGGAVTGVRNDAIQGLRAIAALLVVITHSVLTLAAKEPTTDPSLQHLAWALGETGVQIFFLISGFIMTITMYAAFGASGASGDFVLRRLMRIVPIYWLATAVYVLKLTLTGVPPTLGDLVRSFAFIPYRNEAGMLQPVYGLGWTLNYEMFFYALFALALLHRRWVGICGLLAVLILLVIGGSAGMTRGCRSWSCNILDFYQGRIILYFGGGVLLALARTRLSQQRLLQRIDVEHAIAFSVVLVGCYGLYASGIFAGGAGPSYTAQALTCVSAAAACALSGESSRSTSVRNLMRELGDASYSIYLTHSFLIGPTARLWGMKFGAGGLVPFTIMMLIGSSLLGILTYRCVERPILRTLKQRLLPIRSVAA